MLLDPDLQLLPSTTGVPLAPRCKDRGDVINRLANGKSIGETREVQKTFFFSNNYEYVLKS